MNTVRLFRGIALALLVVFVVPRPAAAQEEAEADTVWVEGDKTVVVMSDDGRRFVIRSTDDDGPRVFFGDGDHDFSRFFERSPARWHYRTGEPRVLEFRGDVLDGVGENVTILRDYLDNMGGVWVDGHGGDFQVELGESMKERTEVMRIEAESSELRANEHERRRHERRFARRVREAQRDKRRRGR